MKETELGGEVARTFDEERVWPELGEERERIFSLGEVVAVKAL